MSEVTIFKQSSGVSASKREPSALGKTMASLFNNRRIQTNTNGTFKRMVNGEQVGNAVRGDINVIITNALPKVSRIFYEGKYDPNAEATAPDCFSNLGDVPDASAKNKQHQNCTDCPQNIKGSAEGGRRACRFQRRIALLLADDDSGDLYQFNIPSKSLFGNKSYTLISIRQESDTPKRVEAKPVAKVQRSEEPDDHTLDDEVPVAEPMKRGKKLAPEGVPKTKSSLAANIDEWGKD